MLEPIKRANQVQVRAYIDPMLVDLSMQNDSIGGMKEMVLLIFPQVFEKCSIAPPKRVPLPLYILLFIYFLYFQKNKIINII